MLHSPTLSSPRLSPRTRRPRPSPPSLPYVSLIPSFVYWWGFPFSSSCYYVLLPSLILH